MTNSNTESRLPVINSNRSYLPSNRFHKSMIHDDQAKLACHREFLTILFGLMLTKRMPVPQYMDVVSY